MILSWRDKLGICNWFEILSVVLLANIFFQAKRKQHSLVVSETDKTLIECLVVEGRETDAVFWIQSLLFVF